MKKLIAVLCLLVPCVAGASDGRINGSDLAEIRVVIHRQIEAFQRDDGPGAFALASPAVQRTFGTPERFMSVVRMAYWAMYRPGKVAFLDLVVIGGEVIQPLQVTDRGGAVWVAYYGMERQLDGTWRANGCHLVRPARVISASLTPP